MGDDLLSYAIRVFGVDQYRVAILTPCAGSAKIEPQKIAVLDLIYIDCITHIRQIIICYGLFHHALL